MSRKSVTVTSIDSGLFSGQVQLTVGQVQSFRVEVDGATGTFYAGSAFTPVPGDTKSQYISTMGFLLSLFWKVGTGHVNHEIKIEQAVHGGQDWNLVSAEIVIGGIPFIERGIPIVGSFARISLTNNDSIASGVTEFEAKVLSL